LRYSGLFLFLVLVLNQAAAQKKVHTNYFDLSGRRYTQGFIILGGGAGLVLIGGEIRKKITDPAEPDKDNIGDIILSVGYLSMLTSVVFFIDAKNQEKRFAFRLQKETIPGIQGNTIIKRSIPALGITISL